MGRIQCVRNLNPQLQHLLKRQRLAGNAMLQRHAVEKLHDNEGLTVVLADFVDGANIGWFRAEAALASRSKRLRACESGANLVRQELQGDEAIELDVLGLVHHAHPTAAQLFEDAVVGNRAAEY